MRRLAVVGAVLVATVVTVAAQEPLTLRDAARLAMVSHPAIDAAGAGTREAAAGVQVAQAGRLPRLAWSGGYTRSNNPVYVFGTVLSQQRFTEDNFAIDRLNHPAAVQNFQSVLSIEQTLFDAHRTRFAVRAARVEAQMSAVERRGRELDVLMGVAATYFGVALAVEQVRMAEQTVMSADADVRRAQALFDSGMTTKADVLAVQVYRASAEQARIRAVNEGEVAGAALNDAIGLGLDERRGVVTPLVAAPPPTDTMADYVASALSLRPDTRQASLGVELAAERTGQASTELWPTVVAQAAVEADGARFADQGGRNWLAGVAVHWDVWRGAANRARVTAARHGEHQADARRREAESATALQVRRSWFAFRSAHERLDVARTTVGQAEEALRIVRNRYESGLDAVTELLRSETALTNARYGRLTALFEQRTTRAALEYAAGRLTASSEVMR